MATPKLDQSLGNIISSDSTVSNNDTQAGVLISSACSPYTHTSCSTEVCLSLRATQLAQAAVVADASAVLEVVH